MWERMKHATHQHTNKTHHTHTHTGYTNTRMFVNEGKAIPEQALREPGG
jgi:hypothetical protein